MSREMFASGKAKYAHNSSTFKPPFKTKEGDTIFRIIPGFKSLAAKNIWSQFHKMHFGYKGVNQTDPSKGRPKPFKCIEEFNFRTKMVTKECPECELIKEKEELLKEREAQLKADGLSKAEIESSPQIVMLKGFIFGKDAHNLDKKYYMNVKLQNGEFGVLAMPGKAKKALDGAIEKYTKELPPGEEWDVVHPDQGVWFCVHRVGTGRNTEYTAWVVEEQQKMPTGGFAKVSKQAPLTDADFQKAADDCKDLTELGAIELTADQIRMLVASSGDPEEVDAIFGLASDARKESSASGKQQAVAKKPTTPQVEDDLPDFAEDGPQTVPSSSAEPKAAISTATSDMGKAMQERLAAIKRKQEEAAKAKAEAEAKVKAEAEAKAKAEAAPVASIDDLNNMSDDDFLKMMGNPASL